MNRSDRIFGCVALLLAACGTPSEPISAGNNAGPAPAVMETHCYLQVTQGEPVIIHTDTLPGPVDSLYIRMDILGDLVNGAYNWIPGEKDRMTGTFRGNREGDRITALYTYQAEGLTGRQEVIFLLGKDSLRIASGERIGNDSLQVFRDKTAVTFSAPVPEVLCR